MPRRRDTDTDSEDTTTTHDTDQLDRDFILLHEAATARNFEAMDQILSPEARLARARGRGRFPALEDDSTDPVEADDEYQLRISQGKLSIDTGYVMRFIDADLRHFSVFDLCSIPELQSFPVPEPALESLTRQQRAVLDQQGYLRIQAAYDSDAQSFEGVQKGWELPIDDPLNELMTLTETLDGRTAPAISYLVATEGPEQWADPGVIAEARDIEESTVREQIQEVKEALGEDRD